jgi:hypothetical protein
MQSNIDKLLLFLTDALGRTEARDSFTEILQYTARIVAGTCPTQELAARRVYKSLSEGRKIFRLFRFIPELRSLTLVDNPVVLIRRLAISQSTVSALFCMLDNLIYYLETVKRKSRGDIRPFKLIKNRVSLLRICIALVLTATELRRELNLKKEVILDPEDRSVQLSVRLWHESLRLWLTVHKLHLLRLFLSLPAGKNRVPPGIVRDKTKYDLIPGVVGLASAVTAFIRKTYLRSVPR